MSNPDDLDDGLVYDFSDNEVVDVVLDAETDESKPESSLKEQKRQLDDEHEIDGNPEEKPQSKRQKKLQKSSKLRAKKKELIQYEINKRLLIPKSDTTTISEFFATLIREKNPNLSALELDEIYLKKNDFISTAKFNMERNLDNIMPFMEQFSKSPRSIILTMSNMRVADLSRKLGGNKTSCKLFAKNKLKDDLATLTEIFDLDSKNKKKNSLIKYFITTPTRLSKILEENKLLYEGKDKLDIIVDASFFDPKDNTILTFENNKVLCQLLKDILNNKSSVKILLY